MAHSIYSIAQPVALHNSQGFSWRTWPLEPPVKINLLRVRRTVRVAAIS